MWVQGIVNDFFKIISKDRSQFASIDNSHSFLSNTIIEIAQESTLGPLLFLFLY